MPYFYPLGGHVKIGQKMTKKTSIFEETAPRIGCESFFLRAFKTRKFQKWNFRVSGQVRKRVFCKPWKNMVAKTHPLPKIGVVYFTGFPKPYPKHVKTCKIAISDPILVVFSTKMTMCIGSRQTKNDKNDPKMDLKITKQHFLTTFEVQNRR